MVSLVDFQTSYNAMSEFFRVGHYFDQQDAERTRTEQLERQKQEQRYLGSLLRLPGMRLYEFNYKTGECREVGTETKLELDVTSGQPVTRRSAKGPVESRLRLFTGPQPPQRYTQVG